MKTLLALVLTAAAFAQSPTFDRPSIAVQVSTDDPAYNPPLPGLTSCGDRCRWFAVPTVVTTDPAAQAFVVHFVYRTPDDGALHDAAVEVFLHDTNGVRAGMAFLFTGYQRIEIVKVTGWLRVNQIGGAQ